MEEFIVGRNAVREALRSRRPFNKVLVQEGSHGGSLSEILELAQEQKIPVEKVSREVLDRLADGVRHQGVAAQGAPVAFQDLDTVLARVESRGEVPLLLLLDELQDPQNVGALIRTANAAGVHGVLLPQRRSCPLNAVVAKISAGAIEYVPVIQIGNIPQTMKQLKKRGFWIAGADMDGEDQYFDANLTGPMGPWVGGGGRQGTGTAGEGKLRLHRPDPHAGTGIQPECLRGRRDPSVRHCPAADPGSTEKGVKRRQDPLQEELRKLYDTLSDEELIRLIQDRDDRQAQDYLLDKYKEFIRLKATRYFLVGAEKEDIIQEGMIGLFKAIRDYRPGKQASFKVFAEICVNRQIISAIKSATRQKHRPLNCYVSLDKPVFEEGKERTLLDMLGGSHGVDRKTCWWIRKRSMTSSGM